MTELDKKANVLIRKRLLLVDKLRNRKNRTELVIEEEELFDWISDLETELINLREGNNDNNR